MITVTEEREEKLETVTERARPKLPLRPRERQIADLMLDHFRVPAIAAHLGISDHTVRNHLKNMYRRLGVHSQQELLGLLKEEAGTPARFRPS
jgi:DNA-binding CsgD family transcriptional regulator